ncbi:MAG: ABC transporter ATP-binding protein [Alphaproteobacteria bacterium]|jgi:NitT/TauT family transport system ATP-binding protein|nr:ABC transporter ATP-binding protein [Roseomonas sp.]MCA3284609.1 ABC transporter ATP-binding protein [Roseomonas sp.]
MIDFRNISKKFEIGRTSIKIVEDINLSVAENEIVCLLGPSGCGKSTLLNLVAGITPPTVGEVWVAGLPVVRPGPNRVLVFQEHNLFPWMRVRQNIDFGLRMRGIPSAARTKTVDCLISELGLSDFVDFYPHQLSGGMRQRVGLGRAFATDAAVLLMDEPFAALDALTAAKMRRLMISLWTERPRTILFVTHSVDEAVSLGDRIVVLSARPARVLEVHDVSVPRWEFVDSRQQGRTNLENIALSERILRRILTEDT